MKQFKLIKKFPASPELGTIVTKQKNGHYIYVNDLNDASLYWDREIEGYPEFWEEVKEKEYTILSFINSSGDLFNIDENGDYRYKTWSKNITSLSLKDMLAYNNKIHSVHREKDGEIFTLGDNLVYGNDAMPIKKFSIIHSDEIALHFGDGMIALAPARKAPPRKPILITEDKVEIFDAKVCFGVSQGFKIYEEYINKNIAESWLQGKKLFSTEKAAQEYIKWSKPMYSLNDISSSGVSSDSIRDIIYELERLNRK